MASAVPPGGATLPGPPAGGARSRTFARRARRRGRSATASAGGSRVAADRFGRRVGVVSRGASRDARSPRSPRQSTMAPRASLSGVEDAATRREDVALLRTPGRTRSPSSACARASARRRSARRAEAGEVSERAARRGAATTGVPYLSDGARRSCVQRLRWFDATARTERVAVVFGVVQLEHPEVVHHRRRKARRLGGARRRHHRHRARRRVLRDDTAGVVVAVVTGHADRKRSPGGAAGQLGGGMRNVRPHTEIRDCRIDGLRRRSSAPE